MKSWFYHAAWIGLLVFSLITASKQLAEAKTVAQQICDSLMSTGASVCQIENGQLVNSDQGTYLIVNKKVYKLG